MVPPSTGHGILKIIFKMAGLLLTTSIHLCMGTLFLVMVSMGFNEPELPNSLEQNSINECSMVSQVQHVVIQILSAHYEYGKGIHKLHSMVAHLRQDIADLKSEIIRLDNFHDSLIPGEPMKHANASYLISSTLKFMYPFITNTTGQIGTSFNDFSQVVYGLTESIDDQKTKYNKLSHRINNIHRHVKRLIHDSKGHGKNAKDQDMTSMAHFMKKQNDINNAMMTRIHWLENRLRHAHVQQDEPSQKPEDDGCLPGFLRYGLSCYKFENRTANWIEAEKHCQSLDTRSHLVGIETKEENDFIIMYRKYNKASWTSYWLWTGGNDMTSEGNWTWVGTGKPLTFWYWKPGQPSNSHQDQHCIYFRADGDNRWDDWHCHAARLNFVCEITL